MRGERWRWGGGRREAGRLPLTVSRLRIRFPPFPPLRLGSLPFGSSLPRLLQLYHSCLLPRLPVDVALAPEILEHHLILVHALDVFRQDRNLSATAGGIDHEVGYGQP